MMEIRTLRYFSTIPIVLMMLNGCAKLVLRLLRMYSPLHDDQLASLPHHTADRESSAGPTSLLVINGLYSRRMKEE